MPILHCAALGSAQWNIAQSCSLVSIQTPENAANIWGIGKMPSSGIDGM